MSLGLRVANAVATARLRAAAWLIARGVLESDLHFWNLGDVCGLDVGKRTACTVTHSSEGDRVVVDVNWSRTWKYE